MRSRMTVFRADELFQQASMSLFRAAQALAKTGSAPITDEHRRAFRLAEGRLTTAALKWVAAKKRVEEIERQEAAHG